MASPSPTNLSLETLRRLYSTKALADITLHFSGCRTGAHGAVLAMASPYFEKVFTERWGNLCLAMTTKKDLPLYGDDPDAVQGMLRWIYGLEPRGAVTESGIYFDLRLFAVAVKYELSGLWELTLPRLEPQIKSAGTKAHFPQLVTYIYKELPTHKGQLRNMVRKVIRENMQSLMVNKEFKEVLLCLPELGLEMMEAWAEETRKETTREKT